MRLPSLCQRMTACACVTLLTVWLAITTFADVVFSQYGDIYTLEMMGQRTTFLTGPAASAMFFKGTVTRSSECP